MNYKQNEKINQVKESTLVVGIDIGSTTQYARAFDWRGIELGKVFTFSNSREGFESFKAWMQHLQDKYRKSDVIVGIEPTGHYWFDLGAYLEDEGILLVMVNPYAVKQTKAQQEQVNTQLVTQGREQETAEQTELENEPVIESETVHVTFTVAECGEFHNLGEYHEGIETIEEAIQLYQAIDPSRMNGIPSISVNMHIEGTEEWEDEQADILSEKSIDVDYLNYTPRLRDTSKVQDALKKLIVVFPEKEVNDRETKEMFVKLAEYKPLAKIEELEEQNYNMIDNVLNNGVKKFNREEEKKEQQEKPQARSSLKERLADKQKEAAQGNNKDAKEQEKIKNSHREM